MLFIFHFILSIFLCFILEIKGISVNKKANALYENDINSTYNDSVFVSDSRSVMSKHKSLLHIIQNPNESLNLKSNVFDKMLSNELLSIKQQLYEKNETYASPFYITFKNSLATPTLEVKQRWPVEKPLFQTNDTNTNPNISNTYDLKNYSSLHKVVTSHKDLKLSNSNNDSKILGVRSFSSMPVKDLERSNNHHCTKRHCTCMKSNPHSSCSFRCSENTKMICTQTENYSAVESKCSRNVVPFTYYPYYIYPTMFQGVATNPSVIYYHPDVINELKLPNHKYPPISKPSVDNIYLEEDVNNEEDEEEYLEYMYTQTKRPNKLKTEYSIDPKEHNPSLGSNELSASYLNVLDRDKFVDDIVEDLKVYYSDAVIKDCYCSLSSLKYRTKNMLICTLMVLTLILYNF